MKYLTPIIISIIVTFFAFSSCTEDDSCTDCGGGLQDGFVYKTVTEDDIAELSGLEIPITLDNCIQFKVDGLGDDIDLETVLVVDNCCCDLYEL